MIAPGVHWRSGAMDDGFYKFITRVSQLLNCTIDLHGYSTTYIARRLIKASYRVYEARKASM